MSGDNVLLMRHGDTSLAAHAVASIDDAARLASAWCDLMPSDLIAEAEWLIVPNTTVQRASWPKETRRDRVEPVRAPGAVPVRVGRAEAR